jgi:hypothetical protein
VDLVILNLNSYQTRFSSINSRAVLVYGSAIRSSREPRVSTLPIQDYGKPTIRLKNYPLFSLRKPSIAFKKEDVQQGRRSRATLPDKAIPHGLKRKVAFGCTRRKLLGLVAKKKDK